MDDLDRASALEIKNTQMALSDHFQRNKQALIVSAVNCVRCDDVIPSARRAAVVGCLYCVDCQLLFEKGRL